MFGIVYCISLALCLTLIVELLIALRTRRCQQVMHYSPVTGLNPVCGAEPFLLKTSARLAAVRDACFLVSQLAHSACRTGAR